MAAAFHKLEPKETRQAIRLDRRTHALGRTFRQAKLICLTSSLSEDY